MAESHEIAGGEEEWDEEGEYDEDSDGGNDDADAEAEEIAKRLGDQLWADISKAQADRAEAAAITTMKLVLAHANKDDLVRSVFSSTTVPNTSGKSVLDVFQRTVDVGTISSELAKSLSGLVITLARSESLFSCLRQSNAASIQLDKGKRKREELDEGWRRDGYKRPFFQPYDLQSQITEASRLVTQALSTPASGPSIDPSMISSIQLPLHQIFLFSVTASAGGGPEMSALQEISGLIQVVGILSGIQIGSTTGSELRSPVPTSVVPATPSATWLPVTSAMPPPVQTTDIGTAVYPCLVAGCHKMFSRLYSLRAHQRGHATHRPFYCSRCPASFSRNHDLKRHAKLHDKKALKCGGCDKIFSRRDAIKRHKNSNRTRGGKGDACLTASVTEVDLEQEEGEEIIKEGRRAKIWNGIAGVASSAVAGYGGGSEERLWEEGEIEPGVIANVKLAITGLHGLLQSRVAGALGHPTSEPPSSESDLVTGQATLASVIARAQLQNLRPKIHPRDQVVDSGVVSRGTPDGGLQIASGQQHPLDKDRQNRGSEETVVTATPSLSCYGLSDEQTRMLELAIANAASAAHAQAEAEAALEEEEEKDYEEDEDEKCDES